MIEIDKKEEMESLSKRYKTLIEIKAEGLCPMSCATCMHAYMWYEGSDEFPSLCVDRSISLRRSEE